tara:strand:+ start:1925 stop:2275 length:351 start_codon:yes stop_codon:yes gene_type:complete
MKENVRLTDIILGNKEFKEWELEYDSPSNKYRLYVVKNIEEESFNFIVLELESSQSEENNGWNTTAHVNELFFGTAVFDGVRHLELTQYINYPSFGELSDMFLTIKRLEEEICTEL